MSTPEPVFFDDHTALRDWLEQNHATATEPSVGFDKVGTGSAGLRWAEAVDEALCVGWIDGIRQRIDDDRHMIRFTPRKPGSIWSAVTTRRAPELVAEGWMRPAGLWPPSRRARSPAADVAATQGVTTKDSLL